LNSRMAREYSFAAILLLPFAKYCVSRVPDNAPHPVAKATARTAAAASVNLKLIMDQSPKRALNLPMPKFVDSVIISNNRTTHSLSPFMAECPK